MADSSAHAAWLERQLAGPATPQPSWAAPPPAQSPLSAASPALQEQYGLALAAEEELIAEFAGEGAVGTPGHSRWLNRQLRARDDAPGLSAAPPGQQPSASLPAGVNALLRGQDLSNSHSHAAWLDEQLARPDSAARRHSPRSAARPARATPPSTSAASARRDTGAAARGGAVGSEEHTAWLDAQLASLGVHSPLVALGELGARPPPHGHAHGAPAAQAAKPPRRAAPAWPVAKAPAPARRTPAEILACAEELFSLGSKRHAEWLDEQLEAARRRDEAAEAENLRVAFEAERTGVFVQPAPLPEQSLWLADTA